MNLSFHDVAVGAIAVILAIALFTGWGAAAL